jgi:hypothetical protein
MLLKLRKMNMMKLKNIYIARAKYVDDDDGVANENGGESEFI